MSYLFFPGCAYATAAGYKDSVDAVNKALGVEFEILHDWNCCGATAYLSLDKERAMALTGRLFALAERQGGRDIVTVCNACYTTLRKGRETLRKDTALRERVNAMLAEEDLRVSETPVGVRHHLEVLMEDVPPERWSGADAGDNANIGVGAYYGCQLTRPWGVGEGKPDSPEQPTILDRFIERAGFTAVEHSAKTMCCGASHAVTNPAGCKTLVNRIVRGVQGAGGAMAVTICPMCQFNVDSLQGAPDQPDLPVLYFTQLAGLALGLSGRDIGLDKLLTPAAMVKARETIRT